MEPLHAVHTLTFDAFGTILDLGGSHAPRLGEYLQRKGLALTAGELWSRWRYRQRIEQYQDNQLFTGHFGYLDSSRRALLYTLRASKLPFSDSDVSAIMDGWQELNPFPDAGPGLLRLRSKYKLVILSNGENRFLAHLVKNRIKFAFDGVISVEDVGLFKPNPAVYRMAARVLKAEPGQLLMVSSNSFDVMGARASGYRGAYVNRYGLPYDETPFQPDLMPSDFLEMATELGC
jgi:2-haloacid dehalogenase